MFGCPECECRFGDKESVRKHFKIGHPEKVAEVLSKYKVKCPGCNQGCRGADKCCPKCGFDLRRRWENHAVGMIIKFLTPP